VIEDYADKMPYPFAGTLKKFVVVLEPDKLTEEERQPSAAECSGVWHLAKAFERHS
jgi:arylsulfatase